MTGTAIRIAVIGSAGRMGRMLVDVIHRDGGAVLSAVVDRPGSDVVGMDAGELAGIGAVGLPVTDDPATAVAEADVVIDFTLPEATPAVAAACRAAGCALVLGTTGLGPREQRAVENLSEALPVVQAPNYSTGVTLLTALVEQAAAVLGHSVDVEIIEAHHRHKVDAPSGTALHLGEAVAGATGRDLSACAVYGREGHTGPRARQTIGFETIRAGDIVGEHTVLFAGEGERLELTHRASSRATFAAGAVRAAHWVVGRAPGLYNMRDVLGIGGHASGER